MAYMRHPAKNIEAVLPFKYWLGNSFSSVWLKKDSQQEGVDIV